MGRLEVLYKDGMQVEFEVSGNSPWTFFNGKIMLVWQFLTVDQIEKVKIFLECGHCKATYELHAPYKNICETCKAKKKKKYVCPTCLPLAQTYHATDKKVELIEMQCPHCENKVKIDPDLEENKCPSCKEII